MTAASDSSVASGSSPPTANPVPQITVLVVDDSPVDRRLAGGIVEKNSDYRAAYASNGSEALKLIAQEPPGVVLTDLLMPEMDGLELVEAIRNQYPLVPVILMTAHGSEDIAMQALQRGAASYVPKKYLARDLNETLEQVLVAARMGRQNQRLRECLAQTELHYVLDNDRTLIPALVAQLQDELARMQLCDQAGRIRAGIALEEALVNALYHGNLEVSSELRQEGDEPFYRLAEQRRRQPPYCDRRIYVCARFSREAGTFIIRDEGPGFDPATVPDPTDPENLGKTSGRGLLLIQTFMDEVRFNAVGNEITMIVRRPKDATA
ncbi:MAG: response regulator [Gemmataceae bacterium]|nr:response regulator [Gemmataceae bacterium]MDW8266859.1 response regulator [Gemmataceae bacterium]